MQFTDKGSSSRTFTKDGYLVVPGSLSRIGVFDYLNSEVGRAGEGITKVARTEKSLFTDATIKSFENAPITLSHPQENVTARNWKQLAVGTMRYVKRDGDKLVGEAWIFDEAAIKTIQEKGIDELSCGYDCNLQDCTDGSANFEMSPMIGNHVAIVANGRCGNVCKLADEEKKPMSSTRKFLDAFLGAFGIKLTDEQAKKVEEEEEKPADEGNKTPENGAKTEPKGEKPAEKTNTEPEKDEDKEKKKMADADLIAKIAALEAENKQLKDAQATATANATQQATLADAKSCFASVQFADNAAVREIHEQAVVSTGIFAKDELATMSDAELAGVYQAAKATAKKLADKALGGVLLQDSKPATTGFDFNSYNQGDK